MGAKVVTTNQAASTQAEAQPIFLSFQAVVLTTFFFLAVFLYVWLRIEPAAEHQSVGPFFFASSSFFQPFVRQPGGLVEYVGQFLGHLNYVGWLGAIVFSVLSLLIFVATHWGLRRVVSISSALFSTIMVLLLVLMRNRYGSPVLSVGIGLLLAMAAFLTWLVTPTTRLAFRPMACLLVSIPLFYLAGFWPCLLFALMGGLVEGQRRESWILGAATTVLGLLPVAASLALVATAPASLIHPWDSKYTLSLVAAIYLLMPLCAAVLLLLPSPRACESGEKPGPRSRKPIPRPPWYRAAAIHRIVFILILVAGPITIWSTFDEQRKNQAKIDYYANREDYSRLISLAAKVPSFDLPSQTRFYLALAKSNLLCTDLFSYGFPCLPELLPGVVGGLSSCRAQSEVLLQLGLISDAEHLAHEALEFQGNRPDLLRTLAIINVLKGRPKAARVFLNVLNQVPFEGAWASARLRDLESDPLLAGDAGVARIRSCLLTNDLPHSGLPAEALLSRLLMTNPRNKLAFEYLLASYLADLDLTKAVSAVPFLNDLGYQTIPRHLEEALLLHDRLNGAKVDLHGRAIAPATVSRFESFNALLTTLPDQGPNSRRALAARFANTYWFYYVIKDADSRTSGSKPPPS